MTGAIRAENHCAAVEKVLGAASKFARSNQSRGVLPPVFISVPDRLTMQAEKILTSGGGLLNARVLTFSMLYHVLRGACGGVTTQAVGSVGGGVDAQVLDKTSAGLYMWRAINDVRGNLVYFGRSVDQYAFAEKMFNTVNQLQSSLVDFNHLEKNAHDTVTKRKMHDIAIIRARYVELTAGYIDGGGQLAWLIDNIGRCDLIKTAHVYVTGFEYLSIQRAEVVRLLARYSASFTAGARDESEFWGFYDEMRFNMQ
jgi:ATP-dependent helicase/DNAse subunit B